MSRVPPGRHRQDRGRTGGSLVLFASLCQLIGSGRVIGVDVEIRPHNRSALEAHPLKPYITLVEGSSTNQAVVDQVTSQISPGDRVLVTLDSNHSYAHVSKELRAYAELVTPGSYLLVQDGITQDVWDVPPATPPGNTKTSSTPLTSS